MIVDIVSVISTDRAFQRIKDVVDVYYISKVFAYNKSDIVQTLKDTGKFLASFNGFLRRADDSRHFYDKFRLA